MLSRILFSSTQIDKATAKNLIIPLSFTLPILILYVLNPSSFELVWKGRAPLLLFLWLLLLELALGWKKLLNKRVTWTWFKTPVVTVTAAAPTIYVLGTLLFGLNTHIIELGKLVGVPYQTYGSWFLEESWPISLEYLFFTAFFIASVGLIYQIDGLKRFSVSLFFLGATSFFYMIDTFYPYGNIVALQAFAPVTASSAIHILSWMGYKAQLASYTYMGMTVLRVPGLPTNLAIGWPSSGAHSLIIYTFVILLFLKDAAFSPVRKIVYVAVGAIGTFIVNVLRIVTIIIIGVNVNPEAMTMFHDYYGELFFIAWIIIYPLTIIYGHKVWTKLFRLGVKLIENGRRLLRVKKH